MPDHDLEAFYIQAQSALKSRDYVRASELLRQILVIDENYKDVSRLLAQTVKLKRRRWYNHPILWGAIGFVTIVLLGFFIAPRLRGLYAAQPSVIVAITTSPTATLLPAVIVTATQTPLPTSTPIPLIWKRISMGLEFPRDLVTALVVDSDDSDVILADTLHAGIYKSINGGISWGPVQPYELSNDTSYQILLNTSIMAKNSENSGNNANIFYNTAPDGIMRAYKYESSVEEGLSTANWHLSEEGAPWRRFSEGGKFQSFNPIAFDKLGDVYVFCGEKICKFDPKGVLIKVLAKPGIGGQSAITLSPNDPDTIYVAGDGIVVSKDGGLTWTRSDNGIGSDLLQLEVGLGNSAIFHLLVGECAYQSDFLAQGDRGLEQPLYFSQDGGSTWEKGEVERSATFDVQSPSYNTGCFLIMDVDGNTLYRHNSKGRSPYDIWLSSNSGNFWYQIGIPFKERTLVADPKRSGVIFALSDSSEQYISKDYGNSWRKAPSGSSTRDCYGSTAQFINAYRPTAIDPRDGDHVYFIVEGALRQSHDSCVSWKPIKQQPPGTVSDVALDPNNPDTIYVSTNNGAYVSYDDGQSWGQVNDGLLGATVVYSIAVDKDSNVYAATPYGLFKLESK
jgi:photosystem II stability/assembly factor-like uncharacterized protein